MYHTNKVDGIEEIPPAILVDDFNLYSVGPYSRGIRFRFVLEQILVLT